MTFGIFIQSETSDSSASVNSDCLLVNLLNYAVQLSGNEIQAHLKANMNEILNHSFIFIYLSCRPIFLAQAGGALNKNRNITSKDAGNST